MVWSRKTYSDLPALSVRRDNLRDALRVSTIAWMYGVVWMACVFGPHMTEFVRMLGFNNFGFGLLAAMPFAATFGQSIAAVIIERTGLRKYQFIYCGTVHRLLWLVVALVPFVLPIPSDLAVATTLMIIGVSWFLNALAQPAYLTWMGDLIPRRIRGRHFATRMRLGRITQVLVVIMVAASLDAVTRHGEPMTAQAQPTLLYAICIVLAGAGLAGAVDILLFRKIREILPPIDTPRKPAVEINFRVPERRTPLNLSIYAARCLSAGIYQLLLEPLKDPAFRRFAGYGMTITFAMTVGGGFFIRNTLENLGFTKLGVSFLYWVIGPISGLVALKAWGKLIDRWGRRPVLMIATVCTVFSVIPNFLAAPQTPSPRFLVHAINWWSQHLGSLLGQGNWTLVKPGTPLGAYLIIMISPIIGATGWAGVQLAKTAIWLGFSDGVGRSKYVAASAVLMSLGGVLGGLVGGTVAHQLRSFQTAPIICGPFLWNNWHAAFAMSMLARMGALVWLFNFPDPHSGSVRGMLQYMTGNAYNYLATRLFMPLRIFGWGRTNNLTTKPGTEKRKPPRDN